MKQIKRIFFLSSGIASLSLGILGIFLPVLPTTPFIILAAFCFKHGSPRLRQWLYDQPAFGKSLKEWDTQGVIRPKAKAFAAIMIFLSVGYVLVFRPLPAALKVIIAVTCSLVLLYILTRKSYPEVMEANNKIEALE